MKVQFKTAVKDGKGPVPAGKVHTVTDEQGEKYIERGLAVEVKEEAQEEKTLTAAQRKAMEKAEREAAADAAKAEAERKAQEAAAAAEAAAKAQVGAGGQS